MKDTPMMRQYKSFKKQYPDMVVLFRMGDFYETFDDDAKLVSKVLNITLTTRDKKSDPTPLAGFPYHALDQYLEKLVSAGLNTVVVDQIEDPKFAKGVVKRGVTRVVTPGTLDGELAAERKSPYLMAFAVVKDTLGVAYCDLSTGDMFISENQNGKSIVERILTSVEPVEVVLSQDEEQINLGGIPLQIVNLDSTKQSYVESEILRYYDVKSLSSLGLDNYSAGLKALFTIVTYIEETQKMKPDHIARPKVANFTESMVLDSSTIRNLDLVEDSYSGSVDDSLLGVIDDTDTPMGRRKLYHWVLNPLLDKSEIDRRLNIVKLLVDDDLLLTESAKHLSNVSDVDRIIGKIGLNRANARDLRSLLNSAENIQELFKLINGNKKLKKLIFSGAQGEKESEKALSETVKIIEQNIIEEPPTSITEGGVIKEGVDDQIDELRSISGNSKEWMKEMEETEREKYGIPSMKIGYNRVFGYYLEVTKTHQDKVPEHYIRKQTLVNSERYITEELKEKEEIILNADSKLADLEYAKFQEVREELIKYIEALRGVSDIISNLDILKGFANNAKYYDYNKPELYDFGKKDGVLEIVGGRHPVVERLSEDSFISNNTFLSSSEDRIAIITGPNMSGKSTYIRQVALIVLMAQIGSYVPAKSAKLSLVDRVFSRVGASDNLAQGRSTFMVEMEEAANILNNATEHSLIILDEVGRGTSTYDGVSIAWSLVEYLVNVVKARTLFATHYHELTSLEDENPELVKNLNVEVKETDDKVLFMRNIVEGGTDQSYGIYVAEMAGIPSVVIDRANEIMSGLDVSLVMENESKKNKQELNGRKIERGEVQFQLFDSGSSEILTQLESLDLENMTPLEALATLSELKGKIPQKDK